MTEYSFLKSRNVAYLIFLNIINNKLFIEEALSMPQFLDLSQQDKAFTRNLVSTAFRNKFKIEYILTNFISETTNLHIKILLSLAMTEIIAINTPNYAVVNTYVELTKYIGLIQLKGLVNAVLKKACDQHQQILSKYDHSNSWLYRIWAKDYGKDTAVKICDALLERSPIDLVFQNQQTLNDNKELGTTIFPNHLRVSAAINIPEVIGYKEGDFWVQGASSFLAVAALGKKIKGKNILDLCSAPGGKAFLLNLYGAKKITAIDVATKRIEVMSENLRRLKLDDKIELLQKNVLKLTVADLKGYDLILLDVPCLATGTIRKHPEVMYLKAEGQIEEISKIQTAMLNNVAVNMPKNSILLYANCSLQKQEGEHLITKFLKNNSNFQLVPITATDIFEQPELLSNEGFLRILPHHLGSSGGMEGFFAAKLQKIAN